MRRLHRFATLFIALLPVTGVSAQQPGVRSAPGQAAAEQASQPDQQVSARVADSAVGEVGQRQTEVPFGLTRSPFARIESRIANRVQSRIRNRLDRYYDPQANATSPFVIAEDKARTAGRTPRR